VGTHQHPVLHERVTGKGDYSLAFHKQLSKDPARQDLKERKSMKATVYAGVSESRRRMVVLLAEMASTRKVVEA
jgi:hypothetical protein